MKKKIYIISPDVKWTTFKKLYNAGSKDSGPTAVGLCRTLWEMNRETLLYCFIDTEGEDGFYVSTKLPKNKQLILVGNKNIAK